ncbi:cyclic pyranopterin monophosphate synthase MoaC [Ruminococcaceae bacterium OttesenSCG-928-A11]|nr:cyclic pyranopterin monophosphate synthase MoaC [Ruminococcaceae bacterium OttesenSCG-928-A11]
MKNELNHFDPGGKAVMVDVSAKDVTTRTATATGCITMNGAAFAAVAAGTAEKGDVLGVARVAGIMAAKRTAELIPMCHPLVTEKATVDFELLPESRTVRATCTVKTSGKTGVEMEALCGVNIALLTVYDMCKAVDRAMTLHAICLMEKQGGKSGHYRREDTPND